jgi:hypothetical protein
MKYSDTSIYPWSRFHLEKLTVAQLVKKFPSDCGSQSALPCSKEPIIGPWLEPDERTPQRLILCVLDIFYNVFTTDSLF